MNLQIRPATAADLPDIARIYNQSIVGSHVSFDEEPWTAEGRRAWFERFAERGRHQCIVGALEGLVVGASYSSPFRPKAGYARSVETTVVVDAAHLGKRFGRRLLETLVARLRTEDVHRVYAVIALPNDASVSLHEQLGFRSVGVLHEVGYKLGRYWSTELFELRLE